VLLWWLNWLPKEIMQALVTLTAASSATFVLYVYLFVLLPVISADLAWLVLVAPVFGVVCWLILRDVLCRHDEVVIMSADEDHSNMNSNEHHDMEEDVDVEDANSTNSWQWSSKDENVSDKDMRNIESGWVEDGDMSLCGDMASDIIAEMFSEGGSLSGDVSDVDNCDESDVYF
jgi:hypothetical protein